MEANGKLFVIMPDVEEFQYCIYEIPDSQLSTPQDENDTPPIGTPVLNLDKSHPSDMSFAAIGSRIYMVGGEAFVDPKDFVTNTVYIYDTLSSTIMPGPDLNTPIKSPFLFTLGSKLFALSQAIYKPVGRKYMALNPEPAFEVLDTNDLKSGWSSLPMPKLVRSEQEYKQFNCIRASAYFWVGGTGTGVIMVSYDAAGTYVFNVEDGAWSYVGPKLLPFYGQQAVSLPYPEYDPSLCFVYSRELERYSAFRISYEVDASNPDFTPDEVKIDYSYRFFREHPTIYLAGVPKMVLGPNGRVYMVQSGVDDPSCDGYMANRYIKVCALVLSGEGKEEEDDETKRFVMDVRGRMTYSGDPLGESLEPLAAAFAM